MSEPVSIRTNNPGAMWGGARATKWGATADIILNDGQKNHIAVFPTKVQGAAAQFDLWRTGYAGMKLGDAVKKWSGGNSSPEYIKFLKKNADIDKSEEVTTALLSSSRGIALMKAQAHWEAGFPYPMTDDEWKRAQNMVFGNVTPLPAPPDIPMPKPKPVRPKETKPAVKSSEIWAQLIAMVTALGSVLTDWHFLVFVVVVAIGYLLYRRYGRGDIEGLFRG